VSERVERHDVRYIRLRLWQRRERNHQVVALVDLQQSNSSRRPTAVSCSASTALSSNDVQPLLFS
jgi:hypothetical protein